MKTTASWTKITPDYILKTRTTTISGDQAFESHNKSRTKRVTKVVVPAFIGCLLLTAALLVTLKMGNSELPNVSIVQRAVEFSPVPEIRGNKEHQTHQLGAGNTDTLSREFYRSSKSDSDDSIIGIPSESVTSIVSAANTDVVGSRQSEPQSSEEFGDVKTGMHTDDEAVIREESERMKKLAKLPSRDENRTSEALPNLPADITPPKAGKTSGSMSAQAPPQPADNPEVIKELSAANRGITPVISEREEEDRKNGFYNSHVVSSKEAIGKLAEIPNIVDGETVNKIARGATDDGVSVTDVTSAEVSGRVDLVSTNGDKVPTRDNVDITQVVDTLGIDQELIDLLETVDFNEQELENLLDETDPEKTATLDERISAVSDIYKNVMSKEKYEAAIRKMKQRLHGVLSDIRNFVGRQWVMRSRQLVSQKDFFNARFLSAYVLGFRGFGYEVANTNSLTSFELPILVAKNSEYYSEAVKMAQEKPPVHLVWQCPISNPKSDAVTVAFSADGQLLAVNEGYRIKVWTVGSNDEPGLLKSRRRFTHLRFSPDGKFLAAGLVNGRIILFDPKTLAGTMAFRGHRDAITSLGFSEDGIILASGSRDSVVRLWDLELGYDMSKISGHDGSITALGFPFDQRQFLSAAKDGTIKVWNTFYGTEIDSVSTNSSAIQACAFNADARLLLTADEAGYLHVFELVPGGLSHRKTDPIGNVADMALNPDATVLATTDGDGVILWSIPEFKILARIFGPEGPVTSLSFSPDGSILALSRSESVQLWSVNLSEIYSKTSDPVDDKRVVSATEFTDKLDYFQYYPMVDIGRFEYYWKPVSEISDYLNVQPGTHIQILRQITDPVLKNRRLFELYSGRRSWSAAVAVYRTFLNSDRSRERDALFSFLQSSGNENGDILLAESRLDALAKIDKDLENEPSYHYTRAQLRYKRVITETDGLDQPRTASPSFDSVFNSLKKACDTGLRKNVLEIADKFGLEIVSKFPVWQREIDQLSVSDWFAHIQSSTKVEELILMEYCQSVLAKDKSGATAYLAECENARVYYLFGLLHGRLADRNDSQRQVMKFHIDQAITYFKSAKKLGWSDWGRLRSGVGLSVIYRDPRFYQIIRKN